MVVENVEEVGEALLLAREQFGKLGRDIHAGAGLLVIADKSRIEGVERKARGLAQLQPQRIECAVDPLEARVVEVDLGQRQPRLVRAFVAAALRLAGIRPNSRSSADFPWAPTPYYIRTW
jgi:hypothetical protein